MELNLQVPFDVGDSTFYYPLSKLFCADTCWLRIGCFLYVWVCDPFGDCICCSTLSILFCADACWLRMGSFFYGWDGDYCDRPIWFRIMPLLTLILISFWMMIGFKIFIAYWGGKLNLTWFSSKVGRLSRLESWLSNICFYACCKLIIDCFDSLVRIFCPCPLYLKLESVRSLF